MNHHKQYLSKPSDLNKYHLTWSIIRYVILLKTLGEDHRIEFYSEFLPIFTIMMDHKFLRPFGLICWEDIEKILDTNPKMKKEIQIELIQPILSLIQGLRNDDDDEPKQTKLYR